MKGRLWVMSLGLDKVAQMVQMDKEREKERESRFTTEMELHYSGC